jgi:putative DNA primase/helicase
VSEDPLNNVLELASRRPIKTPEELRADLGVDPTEDGAALAFVAQHGADLRYCHHAQHWYVWTGSYWKMEETRLAFSWARDLCRELARTAEESDKPKISKAAFAGSVERFAQADRAIAVTAEVWDRDGWLLGTPDGTVDLRTGHMRKSERSDAITRRTSVSPAPPNTPHPIWTKFIEEATNDDAELHDFLQRLAGYILTGDVTEEVLAFLYGEGGTGKGTFLRVLVSILHDYAVSVPIEVFTAGSRLNLEYYRAQMSGARLVTASETEQGATWAESQIKEMTGNEAPLSARQPYGKPFTFHPQFKIILVGNHAPKLKGRSKAMERRMRVTPFKHKPATPDQGLKEKLEGELPAILRWMIEGCVIWQKNRLGTCPSVAAETGNYFEQQDAFGRWIEERCVLDKSLSAKPGVLLSDYNSWAKSNSEGPLTPNDFAETIDRTPGLARAKSNGVRMIKGLGLQAEPSNDRYGRDD